jgi:hypothetical protein
MYRGIALALGLLVTPAAAETYGPGKCEFIRHMLDNCTVHKSELTEAGLAAPCEPTTTGGMQKAMGHLIEDDPQFDYFKFTALCKRVCDGKTTPLDALHKYCPRAKT